MLKMCDRSITKDVEGKVHDLFQLRDPKRIHGTIISTAQISRPCLFNKAVFITLVSFHFCEELLQIQVMHSWICQTQLQNFAASPVYAAVVTPNVLVCIWCLFVPNSIYPNRNGLLGITIRPKPQATFRTADMLLFLISQKILTQMKSHKFERSITIHYFGGPQ
jgi:hypothetical protein